jgi:hypothetical protein
MEMNERIVHLQYLQELLKNAQLVLENKKVAAGLDGFIDSIVKVVNYKTGTEPVFFNTVEEFGNYITNKKGSGFSLESEELFQKLGGNMPILANALGSMGTTVSCVGAFGVPSIAPVFADMHSRCKLFSFTNPGFTTAIEFADGKMMLAQMTDLNQADWNTIKQALSLEKIVEIFNESDLVCLVNWSEVEHSNEIWKGILEEVVIPGRSNAKQQHFFFDLADCSKRRPEAISTSLSLIKQFNLYGRVTISLNRNEAGIVYETLFNESAGQNFESAGKKIFEELNVDTFIIHSSKASMAWDCAGFYVSEPDFIADPKISTGAGDNFNAGFCIASLLGADVASSILLANLASNRYMNTGESPDLNCLQAYISELITATL